MRHIKMFFFMLIIFIAVFSGHVFAQTIDYGRIMADAGSKYRLDNNIISLESGSANWVSLPVNITEDGTYRLGIGSAGDFTYNIYIDGEKYNALENISSRSGGESLFFSDLYLEEGQHSIIFYSDDAGKKSYTKISLAKADAPPSIDTRNKWEEISGYSRMLKIGDMFAGSYINVNIAREQAMISRGGYQYLTYYNSDGFVVAARRKSDSKFFEKYFLPIKAFRAPLHKSGSSDFFIADPHTYISMQMDKYGYIHVAFGTHSKTLKYMMSRYPYDISSWEPESGLGYAGNFSVVSYFSFIKMPDGELLATVRNLEGVQLLGYDADSKTWETLHYPLITDNSSNVYLWHPAVTDDSKIHLLMTWRIYDYSNDIQDSPMKKKDFSGFTNKDIAYAMSADGGRTWEDSAGMGYMVPMTRTGDRSRAQTVVKIDMGEGLFNHFGSDHLNDTPHFTYTKNDGSGIMQQWHLYLDDGIWKVSQVTNYTEKIAWTNPQQNGRASTYVVRPAIAVAKDKSAIVFSRTISNNNSIEAYISDGNYSSWKKIILFDGPAGGWEPQFDRDLWHSENIADILLLGVTDDAVKADLDYGLIKKLKIKATWLLNKIGLLKPIVEMQGKVYLYDYYSPDHEVRPLDIDRRLEKDTGYILEIDYSKLKEDGS